MKFDASSVLGKQFTDYPSLMKTNLIQEKTLVTKSQISDMGYYVYSDMIEFLLTYNKDKYMNIKSHFNDQMNLAPKDQIRIVFYQNECLHTIRLSLNN